MKRGFIDLHLHLDGSLSLESARELAEIEGAILPESDAELKKLMTVSSHCRDLNEYLKKFVLPCSLLQSEKALETASYNLCTELKNHGYLYAEIRFAPQKHCQKGLNQEQVVCAVLKGLDKSQFYAQFILCCMRDAADNRNENLLTVELAKKFLNKGICGCDLAGAESLFPNSRYQYIFERAKELAVPFTIHSGEALGAESVAKALDFGASRIGHGVRAIEDFSLLDRLAESKVALEICPTSNLNTSVFNSISEVPIPLLEQKGVIVTVNSDNMMVSDTDMARELNLVKDAFGYTNEDLKRLLCNSAKVSFLNEQQKERLIYEVCKCF